MDWHKTLAALAALRGHELSPFLEKQIKAQADVSVSPLGNVYAHIKGAGHYTVLLDAHIDEIRMLVTRVDENGFVRVGPCGGSDRRVLPGCEVTVWGEKPLYGVFCSTPPHLKKGQGDNVSELDDMGIDVGLDQQAAQAAIRPGDEVTFCPHDLALQHDRFATKTLDNRAGAAILLRLAELIQKADKPLPVSVVLQFSQLEETSRSAAGGVTGAVHWAPQEAIVLDASFADYPCAHYSTFGHMGGGVMIGFSALLSTAICNRLRNLAKQRALPFTEEVMGGRTGTNADHLVAAGEGVPTGLLSYPIRNMHTPVEIVDPNDLETVAQLLFAYLQEGGVRHA